MDWQIPREELLGSGKLLGQGKFGIVIKTIWRGTPVAIKRFHEYDNNNTITILDEFKNMVLLHHPNIIQTLGYIENPFSIVMEYIEGYDLLTLIKRRPRIRSKIRLSFMRQLLCAIAYLHRRKPEMLIHRDIKPTNIIINMRSMHLKLGDFGISKFVKEKTNSFLELNSNIPEYTMTQNVGTLRYMAPEVYDEANPSNYTYKVDIWSTSMVFYVLWENYQPHIEGIKHNTTVNQYRRLLCRGIRPHFYLTPPRIRNIIVQGWDIDCKKRPQALDWLDQITSIKRDLMYDMKMIFMITI
jgi:serine/threonine protein kinase